MRVQPNVAAGLILLVSCTGASLEGPRTSRDLTGYAQNSCGPADGPAVEIYLSDASPTIEAANEWLDSVALMGVVPRDSARAVRESMAVVLRVLVWRGADQLSGQRFSVNGGSDQWGDVTLCGSDGCVQVPEGSLRFTSANAQELAGEYEMRGPDGGVLAGTFRAPFVERPFPLCG